MIPHPWLLVLCVFGVLGILGSVSGIINERLWISEPLACAAAGIALGPVGLGLLNLDPGSDSVSASVMEEAARISLAIAVTSAAIRLPREWLTRNWRGLAIALGPGMLLMWGVSAALTQGTLGLSASLCFLIGAAVAPTDPVLSAPILAGRLAQHAVPAPLRHGLTAESGANDGLALLFVMLPVLLRTAAPDAALPAWIIHVLLFEIGSAIVVGAAAGWLTGHLLRWAASRPDKEPTSLVTAVLSLSVATLAIEHVIGGSGILAAFAAGAALKGFIPNEEAEARQQRFNEAFGRFFDLPVLIVFGAAIPWGAWASLGWRGGVFALAILLLRRLPAWMLLRRWMPWMHRPREALFAGWFGPIGAGALFYAMEIQRQTGLHDVWPAVSLVVGASVLAHGVAATPLTWIFGRAHPGGFGGGDGRALLEPE